MRGSKSRPRALTGIALLGLLFTLSACTTASDGSGSMDDAGTKRDTPSPSTESQPSITPAPPRLTAAPTQAPQMVSIASLSPGDYLLISDANPNSSGATQGKPLIYAVPLYGGTPVAIGPLPTDMSTVEFTSDGRRVAYYDHFKSAVVIIDALTGTVTELPTSAPCGPLSWSPDQKLITCGTEDVYAINTEDGSATQLTFCAEEPLDPPSLCGDPSWSPDGAFIEYGRWRLYGDEDRRGLYLIDTDCISQPLTCPQRTSGPMPIYGLIGWSPDAAKVAASSGPEVIVYDVTVASVRKYPIPTSADGRLRWSPNGDSIAFDDGSDVYLLSLNSGEVQRFYGPGSVSTLGWISIAPLLSQ